MGQMSLLEIAVYKCKELGLEIRPYDIEAFSCPDKLINGVDDICEYHGDQSLFCRRCWSRSATSFENFEIENEKFRNGIIELQLFLKELRKE